MASIERVVSPRRQRNAFQDQLPVRFGNYILEARIAQGGMAEVYRAFVIDRRGRLPDRVAIKCVRPEMMDDADAIRMMIDEARIAGSLIHDNITRIYDYGRVGETFFIVLEYVAGIDLANIIHRLRGENRLLPTAHVLHIGRLVARALHSVHSKRDDRGLPMKIVHRDVSPQNVMVGFDGSVKLIDFGVATARRRLTCTAVGFLKGKLAYMSPEPANGAPVDSRSDIYSLGVTLFIALTGLHPYRGMTDSELYQKILEDEMPRVRQHNYRVPACIDQIVARCLARDPKKRFRTARQLELALAAVLGDLRVIYRPHSLISYMSAAFADSPRRENADGFEVGEVDTPTPTYIFQAIAEPENTPLSTPQPGQVEAVESDRKQGYLTGPYSLESRRLRRMTLAALLLSICLSCTLLLLLIART